MFIKVCSMTERRRISDEELSDLVDGRLDASTRAEIEHEIERDAALARRYTTLLEQDRLLTRLGAEILNEPVPDRLLAILADADKEEEKNGETGGQGTTGRSGSVRAPQIMVLIMGIAAGVAAGWFGHATLASQRGGLFQSAVEQAAISHRLLEVGTDDAIAGLGDHDVLPAAALPDIFSTPVRAPALRGSRWTPVGLRTETGSGGSAMQIAYADEEGAKVTLYVRRVDDTDDVLSNVVEAEGYKVLYWLDGPMLYALVGDIDEEEMSRLARDVYASRAIGGRWPDDPVPATASEPATD
jgi:anti-sigma factor RsiW